MIQTENLEVDTLTEMFRLYYTPESLDKKWTTTDLHWKIGISTDYGTKCLMVKQHNDTEWSPIGMKYLAGAKRDVISDIIRTYRDAIDTQISDFRKNNLRPDDGLEYQVDHVYPFSHLLADFINLHDPINKTLFLTQPYIDKWTQYHKNNAKLQWLTRQDNLIKSNKLFD